MAWHIQSAEWKKTSNLEYSTQNGYHSKLKDSFPEKQKLKFITTKLVLWDILKGIL